MNVVVCGTPGTGKSSLIKRVESELAGDGFKFINLSDFAKKYECTEGFDEEFGCDILDEDKLVKMLEPELKSAKQRNVIECIHGDLVPHSLVDLVFVCRADNTQVYDRLKNRNYSEFKISNNVEAEIFQTILDEVRGCFPDKPIHELINNELSDLDRNAKMFVDEIRSISPEIKS